MKTKMTILACLLFAGMTLSAAVRTVGLSSFIGGGTTYTTVTAALSAATTGDTIFVAAGIYKEAELTIPAGVTIIGGFPANAANIGTRVYTGTSSIAVSQWTILDGSAAHRVATVNGIIDGCIIRNGKHNTKGGGVLITTSGTVQNCFIRGNQCHNKTNDAIGGGAYLEGSAKLINSVVDYNMASQGFAVAGAGTVTNCTIVKNTNAPTWILVPAAAGTTYGGAAISPFYLAQTETTVVQFLVFLNAKGVAADCSYAMQTSDYAGFYPGTAGYTVVQTGNISLFTNDTWTLLYFSNNIWASSSSTYLTYPMETVSWSGAAAYSSWLGGTLPREVEWEYAATRAENATSAGFSYAGSNTLTDVGWTNSSVSQTMKVALKKANGIGLYDMTGNVSEWTSSAFPSSGYVFATEPINSPSLNRITRGGDYGGGDNPNLATRGASFAWSTVAPYIGFRPKF